MPDRPRPTESEAPRPDSPSGATGPAARRPGVRLLWTVVLLLALAAGLLWLSSGLTWTWSRHATPLRGNVVDAQHGGQAQPALVPLALLALAAIAAVFAIGGWWRRIVGVLVALAGLATVLAGTTGLAGVADTHPTGYPVSQVVAGHAAALLAGLLIVVAGILVVRGAAEMPRLGANYRAPSAARPPRDPDAELWRALSEGEDPTAE